MLSPKQIGGIVVISVVAVVVAFVVLVLVFGVETVTKKGEPKIDTLEEALLAEAKQIFEQQKNAGIDMSSGPCLTNELIDDWVLDVAHSPREAVDNLPENQCPAFGEGRAKHFIELDIHGNLIKMK